MRHRENYHFEGVSLKMAIFACAVWQNRMSQGVENRGSLIGVSLALKEMTKNRILALVGVWLSR